jgi:error-prone DNA polymerase
VRAAAGLQSQSPNVVPAPQELSPQLALDLGDEPDQIVLSGLPEMSRAERVRAELDILGLDASQHVLDFYAPLLNALAITWARDIRDQRNRTELLVAGVKVATQTPPIRTGRRVVFLTIDDSTGPIDATFFEDAQGPYAGTVFHSWLLVVRGVLRRTGAQGASLRATGAWDLPHLWEAWTQGGLAAVEAILTDPADQIAVTPRTGQRSAAAASTPAEPGSTALGRAIGFGRDDGALAAATEQDLESATGLPTGDRLTAAGPRRPRGTREPEQSRKVWHSSPGSAGR